MRNGIKSVSILLVAIDYMDGIRRIQHDNLKAPQCRLHLHSKQTLETGYGPGDMKRGTQHKAQKRNTLFYRTGIERPQHGRDQLPTSLSTGWDVLRYIVSCKHPCASSVGSPLSQRASGSGYSDRWSTLIGQRYVKGLTGYENRLANGKHCIS